MSPRSSSASRPSLGIVGDFNLVRCGNVFILRFTGSLLLRKSGGFAVILGCIILVDVFGGWS